MNDRVLRAMLALRTLIRGPSNTPSPSFSSTRKIPSWGLVEIKDLNYSFDSARINYFGHKGPFPGLIRRSGLSPISAIWVSRVYNNIQRKRSWGKKDKQPQATPKQNIHAKKVMLCI